MSADHDARALAEKIVATEFNGNVIAAARAIDVSSVLLSDFLRGRRGLGLKLAEQLRHWSTDGQRMPIARAPSTWLDVVSGEAKWSLVQGDCVKFLAALTDQAVAHVLTDPPYSEHTHSKSRSGARKVPLHGGPKSKSSKANISRAVDFGFASIPAALREECGREFARVARRWSLVFSDVESSHLWKESLEAAGADYVRTGAWLKIGATPQFTGDRPAVGFEAVTIAHRKGRKAWNGGGSHAVWSYPIALDRGGESELRLHPTQKPLDLMLRLVELFTDPGDIVLDPFAGSATTGVACLRLGRRFIGCELDETHARTAVERLTAETSGSSLKAARRGQAALFGEVAS